MTAKILKFPHGIEPSRPLKANGSQLWNAVNAEYRIEDSAGSEMLLQACEALDRVAECAAEIKRSGVMLRTKTGTKENPLLKVELAGRAFVTRTLARLGLDAEPLKAIGRPAGSFNYGGSDGES